MNHKRFSQNCCRINVLQVVRCFTFHFICFINTASLNSSILTSLNWWIFSVSNRLCCTFLQSSSSASHSFAGQMFCMWLKCILRKVNSMFVRNVFLLCVKWVLCLIKWANWVTDNAKWFSEWLLRNYKCERLKLAVQCSFIGRWQSCIFHLSKSVVNEYKKVCMREILSCTAPNVLRAS